MASISRMRMAWLRLLRSFMPVEAVLLHLVPRATREATAAAELETSNGPAPAHNNPRSGQSAGCLDEDRGPN